MFYEGQRGSPLAGVELKAGPISGISLAGFTNRSHKQKAGPICLNPTPPLPARSARLDRERVAGCGLWVVGCGLLDV